MPTALSASERTLRAKIAAESGWAQCDDRAGRTQAARDAFFRRFLDEVDPERKLDPADRERRAKHARKAYYQRLAFEREKARRLSKATKKARGGDVASAPG